MALNQHSLPLANLKEFSTLSRSNCHASYEEVEVNVLSVVFKRKLVSIESWETLQQYSLDLFIFSRNIDGRKHRYT